MSFFISISLHHINSWTIQLGITRRHSHTYYGQKVKVQRVIPHPHYNLEITHDNDIALFQVCLQFNSIFYFFFVFRIEWNREFVQTIGK